MSPPLPSSAPRRQPALLLAALACAFAAAGCVVVPQTRERYDPECRVLKREVVLETTRATALSSCQGDQCAAVLAATGLFTAASAVVSGSIALVGNVVYWLEARGQCAQVRTVPLPAAPPVLAADPTTPPRN
jgi:hypothetical protein